MNHREEDLQLFKIIQDEHFERLKAELLDYDNWSDREKIIIQGAFKAGVAGLKTALKMFSPLAACRKGNL